MIGGGDAKESTLFTMDSYQWLTVPQRISAGRRAHVARAEEDGKDSIEEAAAVVRTVQPRCVCRQEAPSRRVCGQEGVIVTRQPWPFRNASGACNAAGREGCRDGLIEERVDAVGGPTWERQQSNRADNSAKGSVSWHTP
jgi:hypothetical protein